MSVALSMSRKVLTMKPYLVQRIITRDVPCPAKKGVDKYFSFDYMGSSEFEYGALPEALRRTRIGDCRELIKIESPGMYSCWYVGPGTLYEAAKTFFIDQLQDQKWFLKERAEVALSYGVGCVTETTRVTGWWALDSSTPWAIFKTKDEARLWLKGVKEPK